MRILVTGAAGFVGRALVRDLVGQHEVVALDRSCAQLEGVSGLSIVEGDLSHPPSLDAAVQGGCDAVVHLATVPGGAAEQDPSAGWSVNVEGTAALIDALGQQGNRPRFIFASSIAVLGDPLPDHVDDDTPVRPRMLYGAHKAMMEQWIATLSRRGAINGLSLRLSGIVARPPGPSGMKSAFMSDIFHCALNGSPFVCPVSPEATIWMMSVPRVIANFRHALEGTFGFNEPYAITLPAVRVGMRELAEEIARQTGSDLSLVSYDPDPALEAAFGRYPPLQASSAKRMEFADDGSASALVAAALKHIKNLGA